jgi:superfamily II DNA or RNA helicase
VENDETAATTATRLHVEIERLESQLARARAQLSALIATRSPNQPSTGAVTVDKHSPPAAKVALFRRLFVGRDDAYATRWTSSKTGKSGWSPAVAGGFYTDETTDRDLLPLTDDVIAGHLVGTTSAGKELHAGLYPMLRDDTCRLIACDFDKAGWQADAAAFAHACSRHRIPHAVEISRSGDGAHVWIFFSQRVPAAIARTLGASILREAMAARGGMTLDSYDRFFPAQDLLPKRSKGRMRLGNLIALPLQGARRREGTTVFVNVATWQPFDDQFAYLASVEPLDADAVEDRLRSLRTVRVGPTEAPNRTRGVRVSRTAPEQPDTIGSNKRLVLRSGAMLAVPTAGLPASALAELKHAASITNPEFYRRQAQRFSTFGVPRFVACFEHDESELRLPRGLADQAERILTRAGVAVEIASEHPVRQNIAVRFHGELRSEQADAVRRAREHEIGVIAAPPGFGKTVVACALIAERNLPTAIIVNRNELATQWREQLALYLGLPADAIGQLGAGRQTRKGAIDIIMLQSISHRSADPAVLDEYGQIIVDECHSIGAPATEAAIKQVNVRYWVGLTATPYRADHMDGLITMQCGPIRFNGLADLGDPVHSLVVHETSFSSHEPGDDGPSMQAIYTELAEDEGRNSSIAADVLDSHRQGRSCLVLSNRVDHVIALSDRLRQNEATVYTLHGRLTPDERLKTRAALAASDVGPFILVATDQIAGEGLDLPALDTLFLTVPISFKGRVVQQVGRITRSSGGESRAVVHDYHDRNVPIFDRMFRKRRRIMAKQGFVESTSIKPGTGPLNAPA